MSKLFDKDLKQHGGRRIGAGRKKLFKDDKLVSISIKIPATTLDSIDNFANSKEVGRSEIIRSKLIEVFGE